MGNGHGKAMGDEYGKSMGKCCACIPVKQQDKRLPGPPGIPPAEAPEPRLLHGVLEITLDVVDTSGMPSLFRVRSFSRPCRLHSTSPAWFRF
jgi:hypothetical protein